MKGLKNINMRKLLYLLFLIPALFFIPAQSKGQIQKPIQKDVRMDSSKVVPAKFNRDAIRAYAEQKEFKYDQEVQQQLSFWDRFWMWFWNMISRLVGGAASNVFSRYFFIGLGIALIVFVVIKMIGMENIFSKKSKETILPYDILNENIHEIDYEQELQRLISEGKYRLAVRLLYLRSLKKLSDAQLIEWKPDKTNYQYLNEISKPDLKNEFSGLTLQFDYIWYGDFPVDEQKFQPINLSFNQFNKHIG